MAVRHAHRRGRAACEGVSWGEEGMAYPWLSPGSAPLWHGNAIHPTLRGCGVRGTSDGDGSLRGAPFLCEAMVALALASRFARFRDRSSRTPP